MCTTLGRQWVPERPCSLVACPGDTGSCWCWCWKHCCGRRTSGLSGSALAPTHRQGAKRGGPRVSGQRPTLPLCLSVCLCRQARVLHTRPLGAFFWWHGCMFLPALSRQNKQACALWWGFWCCCCPSMPVYLVPAVNMIWSDAFSTAPPSRHTNQPASFSNV